MAAGSSSGDGSSGAERIEQEEVQKPDPSVLDELVEATLSSSEDESRLDTGELEALRHVARRHLGMQLTLDPVATDLIQALLMLRYPGLPGSHSDKNEQTWDAPTWRTVSREVAEVLLDSQHSSTRLTSLWDQLSESVK